jgi:glycosyltransferase involved in cell wall biosynthesis
LMPEFPPKKILHDMPNRKMIEVTRANQLRSKQSKTRVIWVGNSKWGKKQGFHDHKGFYEVVKPLKNLLQNCDSNIVLEIIDSGESRISYELVLQKIRDSDVLIQTSSSEGTGLPLLEALGLETDVITTDVGVASEVLGKGNTSKFIGKNLDEILSKLQKFSKTDPTVLRNLYVSYCQVAESEKIPEVSRTTKTFSTNSSIFLIIQRYVKWYYRFIMRQR